MDRLEARELIPLLRFEVINERPEKGANHALSLLARRNTRHLVGAHRLRQPRDVVDGEVAPARRGLLDRLFEFQGLDQTRTSL